MKARVEIERQRLRQEAKDKANTMLQNGDFQSASKKFIEAIEITNDMVHSFVNELKSLRIDFLIAPYEADA
jgi:exonuclease 1